MNLITIDTKTTCLYLRTTENTYEIRTSKQNKQYVPLTFDLKTQDENEKYRLKVYVNIAENDYKKDENYNLFNIVCKKAHAFIREHVKDDNTIILQERTYLENKYYTIYEEQKGKLLFWN